MNIRLSYIKPILSYLFLYIKKKKKKNKNKNKKEEEDKISFKKSRPFFGYLIH